MSKLTTQPKNWRRVRLGDICRIKTGKTDSQDAVEGGLYPLFDRSATIKRSDKFLFNTSAIILPGEGAEFTPRFYEGKFDLHQRVYAIYCDEEKRCDNLNLKFLYYFLLLNREYFAQTATGATVKSLRLPIIADCPVILPPFPTQQQIAGVLSTYDDLIENNTKRIKILEEIAQAIYREWFIDNSKFKNQNAKLENYFSIHRGKSYRSDELAENAGVPFINLKCIDRDGGFRKSGLKRFIGTFKEWQKVIAGDIVVAVTDMTQERRIVAHAARIPTLEGGFGVISMDLVKLQPKENCDPNYLYCLLRWSGFADEVKNHANGANVLHLNPARITDYKTFVASSEKQKEFGNKVRPIFDLIDRLELQNEALRPARDLLLPKLVTGEIEVK